jgi:hypothetical protein
MPDHLERPETMIKFRLRMMPWLAVPAAGGLLLALVLAVPASAQNPATGPYYMCDPSNGSYCWTQGLESPFLLSVKKNQKLDQNEVDEDQLTTACGDGYVTATCPFTDHKLDAATLDHKIIVFSVAYGFMASASGGYFYGTGDCCGSNVAFIPTDNGKTFVSVGASNYANQHLGLSFPADNMEVCPSDVINESLVWHSAAYCGTHQSWKVDVVPGG